MTWVMSTEDIGLPSMTSTYRGLFRRVRGIWCWRAKVSSIIAKAEAPVSTSAWVWIVWSLFVRIQDITK